MTTRLTFTGHGPHTVPQTPFAALLRSLRTARHVSQTCLAERAGFDHSYISRIETGTRTPSREAIEQLARALQLDPAECDALLAAAGFLPGDVASLLSQEPELSDVLAVLRNEALGADYRDAVRGILRSLVEQASIVAGAETAVVS
jgi:transcriptional regulator with XRE-family HTH domain